WKDVSRKDVNFRTMYEGATIFFTFVLAIQAETALNQNIFNKLRAAVKSGDLKYVAQDPYWLKNDVEAILESYARCRVINQQETFKAALRKLTDEFFGAQTKNVDLTIQKFTEFSNRACR